MTETINRITSKTQFEDSCYTPMLVALINRKLNTRSLHAIEMWYDICELVHRIYDQSEEPYEGTPVQTSLETVPRENLIAIICARKIRGYQQLAKAFGYRPDLDPSIN